MTWDSSTLPRWQIKTSQPWFVVDLMTGYEISFYGETSSQGERIAYARDIANRLNRGDVTSSADQIGEKS